MSLENESGAFDLTSEIKSEIGGLRTLMAQASFSRLSFYKNCPRAYKFKYVDKMPTLTDPEQLDNQGNIKPPAWQRGSVVHQAMDDYINGKIPNLIPELRDLAIEINDAKRLKEKDPKRVLTEQNKYFDLNYNLIDMDSLTDDQKSVTSGGDICPKNYHVLIIIDLLIFNEDFTHATVIDLKTGRKHGNEVKHGQQTQLYALFTAIEYPRIQTLQTQLWYSDQKGAISAKDFTRDNVLMYLNFWNRSIEQMHADNNFFPNPHEQNCMFCSYGLVNHSNKWISKTGDCPDSRDKRDRIN